MFQTVIFILWGCIGWLELHLFHPIWGSILRFASKRSLFGNLSTHLRFGGIEKISKLKTRSQMWALRMEGPHQRRLRTSVSEKITEKLPNTLSNNYENLRFYLLSDRWEPYLNHIYVWSVLPLAILLAYPISIAPLFFATNDIKMVFEDSFLIMFSSISLLTGILAFGSAFQQVGMREKIILTAPVIVSIMIWLREMGSISTETNLGFIGFLTLFGLTFGGLLSIVSIMAFGLQWRFLGIVDVIHFWISAMVSTAARQNRIKRTVAWLLFLAPNGDGRNGLNTKEIDFLLDVNRIEREGAEWRGVVLAIVAFLGVANFQPINSNIRSFLTEYTFLRLGLADPRYLPVTIFFLFLVMAILAEIWLSEFPNQIIGRASVEAKYLLVNKNTSEISREFKYHRVVILSKPESIDTVHSRWHLIAKQSLGNEQWLCLIEAKRVLDLPGKDGLLSG